MLFYSSKLLGDRRRNIRRAHYGYLVVAFEVTGIQRNYMPDPRTNHDGHKPRVVDGHAANRVPTVLSIFRKRHVSQRLEYKTSPIAEAASLLC